MPSPAPFWDDDPDAWDAAVLGGVSLPGLARIDGLELSSKWDVKEAPGTDGATETYQGYTPTAFQLVLRIWLREQWDAWLSMARQFRPKPGKESPKPIDITHPDLAVWGISRVVIRKLKPKKQDGFYEVSFDLLEYFAQPKKTVTTTAGSDGLGDFANALTGYGETALAKVLPPSKTKHKP